MDTTRRSWAGVDLRERRRLRRERLLAVGVDLLGSTDGAAANVRAVCRAAELTERYFYESFADRDTFVREVYAHVANQARDALARAVISAPPAGRAEAAVRAFVELMVDDPAKGRVLLLAPLREPAISRRGVELAPSFVALVRDQLPPGGDEGHRSMVALGVVGALTSLFMGYLEGDLAVSRETLIRHCVGLVEQAGHTRWPATQPETLSRDG
ncbi:TetR/AcrR family transcriptional regulator [Rhodococcus sp. Z13]|uniref:TetR/AcrR family transcriptional regulator n=1 Tax=Rhodococcus sacchari TaxID=2962047 RepID=A0ACD4DCZ9_9NOCA|nr:TetR/AcrR family transcriptional regulator [Rhodococcus sp. Z13]UYP17877.1 TetR/AcrR family transcriptional regulator [Rhodococcus sp. Z13]